MPWKQMWDAMTKSRLLKVIYGEVGAMNRKCKDIFEESFDCLVCNKDELARHISDEDRIINEYEVQVRKEILNYLAINTAPDIGAALILTSVVVEYERIGDYCKGIAGLGLRFPTKLDDNGYMAIIRSLHDSILKQFDLTYDSFRKSDAQMAQGVIDSYQEIKTLHDRLTRMLNDDQGMGTNKAIVYASLGIYLRRISAHLKNVATAVVKPFPLMGYGTEDYEL